MIAQLRRWWYWLWTGHDSLASKRRQIEEDARRFGGRCLWDEP